MIYYVKDNKIYSSDVVLSDSQYQEITYDEYIERKKVAVSLRDMGVPVESDDIMEYSMEEQWQI